jgi:hypothetical protein
VATALDMIKRAMRLNKVYSIGEDPSADEAQDMLSALNSMLDAWSVERLMVYVNQTDQIAFTAGVSSKTIGPTGDTVSNRPVAVDYSTYLTCNGVDYPIRLLNQAEYDALPKKDVQGIPTFLFANPTYPNATLYLFPTPGQNVTLNLVSQKALTGFADLTTDLAMPPGYQDAIEFSLAEYTAPEFGVTADPRITKRAALARKNLKRLNTVVPVLDSPADVVKQRYYIGFGFI